MTIGLWAAVLTVLACVVEQTIAVEQDYRPQRVIDRHLAERKSHPHSLVGRHLLQGETLCSLQNLKTFLITVERLFLLERKSVAKSTMIVIQFI